jgi:hypothetical protein
MQRYPVVLKILVLGAMALCGMQALAQQKVQVVKRLDGYQCMALAAAYGSQGAFAPPVPVYTGPQANAPQAGTAAGVIIVPSPLRIENGRTPMIAVNGNTVWIAAKDIVRWHSVNDPHAVCQPALLSNGRYGFITSG